MTSMPSYPSGSNFEPNGASRPTPPEVQRSVQLWFASIVIAVIGGILSFFLTNRDAAAATLTSATSTLSAADAKTAVAVGLVIGLFFTLVILGLEVLFVLKMKAGRNWARIVLTVLGALAVLSTLSGFARGISAGSALSLIALTILVGAIVMMYRPNANEYFAKVPQA